MSKLQIAGLVVLVTLVAGVAAGGIGAGMATAVTKAAGVAPAPDPTPDHVVESAVLGERRRVEVALPAGYAATPEARYPLLVTLDGPDHLAHSAHSADALATLDLGPETIVAAVRNEPGRRDRDLLPPADGAPSGQADRFLAFLADELRPALDSLYRTDGTAALAGHSYGGTFATYAWLERPDAFDAVFAFSPSFWVADEALLDRLEKEPPDARGALYLAVGGDEGREMQGTFARAEAILAAAPPALRWQADTVPHADHGSAPRRATPLALRFWAEGR